MVFFTCNNCGDSLKKKDCANHAGKCRPLALTCVDCHKDFFGDQFMAHISCVTEAEKYGVKGFRSPAPSTAGLAKQGEWIQAVLSASLKTSELTSSQKYFIGILTRHGNVPRKKKQFQNFAKSVWRDSVRQIDVVETVYEMLESELKKIKGLTKENDSSNTKANGNTDIEEKAEDKATESDVGNSTGKKANESNDKTLGDSLIIDSSPKPKKSKKKHKEEICDNMKELTGDQKSVTAENDTESKKIKKRKKKIEEEITENGNGIAGDCVNIEDPTSTKRKKRKKQIEEEITENGNGIAGECVNAEDPASTKSKKKKRKRKDAQEEEDMIKNANGTVEASVNTEGTNSVKVKSKKQLVEVDQNGSVQMVEDFPKKSKKKKQKKCEENYKEATVSLEESPVDAAKEKSKKKKKRNKIHSC